MTRVLVVDDEADIRESLRLLLEDAGHEVLEAGNGFEALDVLRASEQPLVVLLDLLMPQLDGVGMLHAVVADPWLATNHAYVLITADNKAPQRTAIPQFSSLYLVMVEKPFDMDELLDAVADAARRLLPPD
jgi:CheY-like chemotaxis protein